MEDKEMNIDAITLHSCGIFLCIVAVFYIAVLALVFLDLWSGIRKAKKMGVYRSSKKLRRTIEKLSQYYNVMVMVTIIDCVIAIAMVLVGISIPAFPYLSLLGTVFVGIIEIKSVFEKVEEKDQTRVQEAIEDLQRLSKNKDLAGILDAMSNMIKTQNAENANGSQQ